MLQGQQSAVKMSPETLNAGKRICLVGEARAKHHIALPNNQSNVHWARAFNNTSLLDGDVIDPTIRRPTEL